MALVSKWYTRIGEIPSDAWKALQADALPFLEYQWLLALERSGCLARDSGWAPLYLTLWRGSDLVAVAPLYLKMHSWGEFVFDQEWANASMRMGIPYYPKLVGMSPFTPAQGYRFLLAEGEDSAVLNRMLAHEIDRLCEKQQIAGCHFLHVDPEWRTEMEDLGWSAWLHHALIWENAEYDCFDGYLSAFNSKQRKNIKRERRRVVEQGLDFQVVRGSEAPDLFDHMYPLYADTCAKFANWSRYLTPDFFTELKTCAPERVVFVAARHADVSPDPLAMSLLVQKGDHMFGRYWGCLADYDQLHFETCYYQAIDWAIANGVRWFHAGSGNARHKYKRGFPARRNYSLHKFQHPVMQQVWDENINRINEMEQMQIDHINGEKSIFPKPLG